MCDNLFVYWRIHPTPELDAYWENYITTHEDSRTAFNEAIESFDEIRRHRGTMLSGQAASMKTQIERLEAKKKRKRFTRYVGSAAAVLLLAVVSTFFFPPEKTEKTEPPLASIGETMNNNNIQLFTANGMVEIDNNSTVVVSQTMESVVISNPHSQKEIDLKSSQTNTLVIPYGKRSTLILSDGSKVHLNSGTKMEFPGTFAGKKREISVEGEIFIEVAKQNNMPFILHTPHSEITVYGTSFNVSSYSEDAKESVVLVKGSVEVQSEGTALRLRPNEMAEVENGRIARKQVDVSDYIGWTEGYMQLNREPLNEVLKRIGRYYNVTFRYGQGIDLPGQTCSGKLFLSDNLDDVLESFSKMTRLQYESRGSETIYIRK